MTSSEDLSFLEISPPVANGTVVPLAVGNIAVSRLAEAPSTGYMWEGTAGDPSIISIDDYSKLMYASRAEQGADPVYGSPDTRIFSFTALAPGSCTVTLTKSRPWAPSPEDQSFSFDFNVT